MGWSPPYGSRACLQICVLSDVCRNFSFTKYDTCGWKFSNLNQVYLCIPSIEHSRLKYRRIYMYSSRSFYQRYLVSSNTYMYGPWFSYYVVSLILGIVIYMCTSGSASKHSFILQLFEAMPKGGRLQCISRGFHPLDVWAAVLSDSPWTANRRSRSKKAFLRDGSDGVDHVARGVLQHGVANRGSHRFDIRSIWGLYKMHETLWFCLVSL